MWDPDRLFDFKDALPAVLKELRGYAHQKTVAQRCGISTKAWSRYETGKQMPKSETLLKIAQGLGVDPIDLVRLLFEKHVQGLERNTPPTVSGAGELRDAGATRTYRAVDSDRAVRTYGDALFTDSPRRGDAENPHELAVEGLSLLLQAFRAK